jgi:hypothetical protein
MRRKEKTSHDLEGIRRPDKTFLGKERRSLDLVRTEQTGSNRGLLLRDVSAPIQELSNQQRICEEIDLSQGISDRIPGKNAQALRDQLTNLRDFKQIIQANLEEPRPRYAEMEGLPNKQDFANFINASKEMEEHVSSLNSAFDTYLHMIDTRNCTTKEKESAEKILTEKINKALETATECRDINHIIMDMIIRNSIQKLQIASQDLESSQGLLRDAPASIQELSNQQRIYEEIDLSQSISDRIPGRNAQALRDQLTKLRDFKQIVQTNLKNFPNEQDFTDFINTSKEMEERVNSLNSAFNAYQGMINARSGIIRGKELAEKTLTKKINKALETAKKCTDKYYIVTNRILENSIQKLRITSHGSEEIRRPDKALLGKAKSSADYILQKDSSQRLLRDTSVPIQEISGQELLNRRRMCKEIDLSQGISDWIPGRNAQALRDQLINIQSSKQIIQDNLEKLPNEQDFTDFINASKGIKKCMTSLKYANLFYQGSRLYSTITGVSNTIDNYANTNINLPTIEATGYTSGVLNKQIDECLKIFRDHEFTYTIIINKIRKNIEEKQR